MWTKTPLIFILLVSTLAQAQQPTPERIINVTGPVQPAIDAQVSRFNTGGRADVLRQSDVLIYPYGIYQPVLTCTVLRACIVELQPGEGLISLIAGDDQRWLIDHTATGTGAETAIVSVKPIDHNITTNLIISTDRRVYHITLDSPPYSTKGNQYNPQHQYTRHIRFYYPTEQKLISSNRTEESDAPSSLSLQELNHHYTWRAEKGFPWVPTAVFDDGERVYIQIPSSAYSEDQPLLSIGTSGAERVTDYVVRDGYFIVDGLFDHARLITGGIARKGLFLRKRHTQRALHLYKIR
ncbi:MAG: TrbG/VirB9 family P-type conjugative transfer protein [Bacteroidetes bacterium]|nr:TrbG/VirB9 family P-type conjugative transfer protein [Bacteroidota bacterium]MCY4205480.1 TrbG/VirB9 family P-type conjugative transfer protein [Bacteroidota bacterium]